VVERGAEQVMQRWSLPETLYSQPQPWVKKLTSSLQQVDGWLCWFSRNWLL